MGIWRIRGRSDSAGGSGTLGSEGVAGEEAAKVERVEGIEPSTKAWEAFVLPLNYTRISRLTLYQNPSLK
jgi:hypothetical protein